MKKRKIKYSCESVPADWKGFLPWRKNFLFLSLSHMKNKTFLLFLGILGKTFHLVFHRERKTSPGISPGSLFHLGNILQGICFSLSFKHWTFLSSWFFPFCLEKMLSVMRKWKNNNNSVKMFLEKGKKRFHVWNWMQVYSPDLFFFLNLYFINE